MLYTISINHFILYIAPKDSLLYINNLLVKIYFKMEFLFLNISVRKFLKKQMFFIFKNKIKFNEKHIYE